jgi:GTP-binding protein EngB required for normal cell division
MTAATEPAAASPVEPDRRPTTGGPDDPAVGGLLARVSALHRIIELGRRHDLGIDLDAAGRIAASTRARLRHGSAHTVVALAGSTGSGKSSLLNAVTGIEVAEVGLGRPTTTATQAVVYPPRDDTGATRDAARSADGLLDWLDIRRRHHLPAVPDLPVQPPEDLPDALAAHAPGDMTVQAPRDLPVQAHGAPPGHVGADAPPAPARPDLRGLVLLDLPDFDSTELANRAEVERLVALVDLMIWVTDPQKYADQALHQGFLAPLSGYAAVIEVVLNKADTLTDAAMRTCLGDLDRLLEADGLGDVHPLAVSALTGQGLAALRGLLAAEVAARQAVLDRVDADLTVAAARLGEPGQSRGGGLDDQTRRSLVDGLARAVGVDAVAALVAAQHRRDATLQVGWPPLRWARRMRRAPIAALRKASGSHVARAEVSQALRTTAETAGDRVEPTWRPAIREATSRRTDEIVTALDRRTSVGVHAVSTTPRWWRALAGLHGLLLATAAAGALWLAALFLLDSLLLLDIDALTPRVRAIPLPTLLLVGGLGAGLLLALLARPFVAVGVRRRAGAARRRIDADVGEVADEEILAPLEAVLADRREVLELQAQVAGHASRRPGPVTG